MKVTADSYTHEFHFLSDHEIFFDRKQAYRPNYSHVDVYGTFWSFLFAEIPKNSVYVTYGETSLSFSGKVGVLIPPHSILKWSVTCPSLHWFAYSNNAPYPGDFPTELTVYPLNEIPETISPDWIKNLIQKSENTTSMRQFGVNPYAKKFKTLLDAEFKLNRTLSEYAMELGISKEWLIKYFRKSFGVTPIYYRNEKRMMEALFLLHVEKNKIVNLSQEIGFNDLKHFNQLFKKAISVPPSKFLDKEL
jgi:AraC-like DNA-binding protein